jgi:hypothetical protein
MARTSRQDIINGFLNVDEDNQRPKRYQCEYCDKKFGTPQAKCKHKKICPLKGQKPADKCVNQLQDNIKVMKDVVAEKDKVIDQLIKDVFELKQRLTLVENVSSCILLSNNINDPQVTANVNNPMALIRPASQRVNLTMRRSCWLRYIGEEYKALCLCCKSTPMTIYDYHCGHVIAKANGGHATIDNLRPICSTCNSSMGTANMKQFAKEKFNVII